MSDPENGTFHPNVQPVTSETTLRLYTPDQLLELPPPEWLVEPYIVRGALTVLFGRSNVYKSFCAIDWAARAPGPVVYFSAEGSPHLMGLRIKAWEHAADRQSGILVHPYALSLPGDIDRVIETLKYVPGVVCAVIDTLSRNMTGNENSTEDMAAFVAGLDRIRAEVGCSLLVLHHAGHENSDRERGSGALPNAADVRVHARRSRDLEVTLTCVRVPDAEEFKPRTYRLEPIQGSLVVVESTQPPPANREAELEAKILAAITRDPGASQKAIEAEIPGRSASVREGIQRLVNKGHIRVKIGARNARLHYPADLVPSIRDEVGRGGLGDLVPASPPPKGGTQRDEVVPITRTQCLPEPFAVAEDDVFSLAETRGFVRVPVGRRSVGGDQDSWTQWRLKSVRGDPDAPTPAEVYAELLKVDPPADPDDVRAPE